MLFFVLDKSNLSIEYELLLMCVLCGVVREKDETVIEPVPRMKYGWDNKVVKKGGYSVARGVLVLVNRKKLMGTTALGIFCNIIFLLYLISFNPNTRWSRASL
jgi:hypothetical protein